MASSMKAMRDLLGPYFKMMAGSGFFLTVATALGYLVYGEMSLYLWAALAIGLVLLGITATLRWNELWKSLSRRSFKTGANLGVQVLVILGILVIIQAIGQNHSLQVDLTKNKRFSLAAQSKSVLQALKAPVKVTGFFKKGAEGQMGDILKMYSKVNSRFSYEFVDPDRSPVIARNYGVTQYGTVVFESQGKTEKINTATEEDVTNAVVKVTRQGVKNFYFVTGHGENSVDSDKQDGYGQVKKALTEQGYEVKPLLLAREKQVPADANVVVLSGPQSDLFPKEMDLLTAFIKRGGHLMVQIDPDRPVNGLKKWLSQYGIKVGRDVIVDPMSRIFGADVLIPVVSQYENHRITSSLKVMSFFPYCGSVDKTEKVPDNSIVQVLANTSPNSWAKTDIAMIKKGRADYNPKEDRKGPISMAVAASVDNEEKGKAPEGKGAAKGQLVVFGNSCFAQNNYFNQPGNRDFYMNALNFLAEEEDLIAIAPKSTQFLPILLRPWQGRLVFIFPVVLIPLLLLGGGGYIIWRRRSIFK